MTYDADLIADRRRLRRKLIWWRVLAFFGVILAILGVGYALGAGKMFGVGGQHIARVTLKGFIAGDTQLSQLFKTIIDDKTVEAVILRVDSPGGSTAGSEAVYESIRGLADKKPTVAVIDGMAASGAYIAVMGAERIFARETSLVGSIGVLVQFPNVSRLLDTVGVKVEEVKSSPLKASPNGFEPTSPEARAALQALVVDSFNWFKGLVQSRRQLSDTELATVADGRVFTGRQALPLKLIDSLGSEKDAQAWLETDKKVSKDLKVKDWKPKRDAEALEFWNISEGLARTLGWDRLAGVLAAMGGSDHSALSGGVMAIWSPEHSLGVPSPSQP